jgi:hypothetical protein
MRRRRDFIERKSIPKFIDVLTVFNPPAPVRDHGVNYFSPAQRIYAYSMRLAMKVSGVSPL